MAINKTNDFLSNSEVNNHLQHIIDRKLFSNGYIFSGTEGLGKKKAAIEFAKALFKQFSSSKNIEEKISNNNHPDFLEVKPQSFIKSKIKTDSELEKSKKSNADVIKIDQIRVIKNFLSQKSIESEKKIVLIYEAHCMNEAASNCLLKTLEEPCNGIIILLTSKLNFLLDTIKSRCQIIRFKSFSTKSLEEFFENNQDSSTLKINQKINFQDLVNSANGSPGQIINNLDIWNELPNEIINQLDSPLTDYLEILKLAKLISEKLEIFQQTYLVNLIQQIWWRKTRNASLVKKLETLKSQLKNKIQPRLAWEVSLLKIAIEDT